uniref:Uncharacterized protein n=1 Tax=Cannabis sativa TaxID=3483 RepID=A0A803NSQ7_CANSA
MRPTMLFAIQSVSLKHNLREKLRGLELIGGEYQVFQDLAVQNGIDFHHSCPHILTKWESERKHRHIVEMGLTLLAQAHASQVLVGRFSTSVCLINRLPTGVLENKAPFEVLYSKQPNYSFLKTFGVACFPCLRPYQTHKFQFHSIKCVNLGYSESHKGYKCLSPTGRIYISKNVVFNELEFPFQLGFLNNYQHEKPVIVQSSSWSYLPTPTVPLSSQKSSQKPAASPSQQPSSSAFDVDSSLQQSPHNQSYYFDLHEPSSPGTSQTSAGFSPAPTAPTGHPMITRAKAGIFKPRAFAGTATWHPHTAEPLTVTEALAHPGWNSAMNSEVIALKKNKTWILVPRSDDQNLIGNKWVYREKLNADGSFQRFKARLVAKGFHQRPGIDFGETFSPVIKASTVRIVLTIAVTKGWDIGQLDINNAFLNGTLVEDVYMAQPEGFVEKGKEDYVCKLNKSLYGLRQAPRAWFEKLKNTLSSWKFKNSKADTSLFFYKTDTVIILVLIYVDDIIVTGNDSKRVKQFIDELNKRFTLKDLGPLHFFLGIEVYRDETGIYLTQTRYIEELLRRTNFTNLKICPTPATAGKPMSLSDGEPLNDPTAYRSIIGGLQYLSHTRPDISYAVNKLSQFLKAPTTTHWNGAKRVLRYLKGTMKHGLHIGCDSQLTLTGYSDADWACCPDDRRSVAGYCVYFGNTLVSWSSKKQNCCVKIDTESEYRALAHVAAEISWVESLLKELEFPLSTAVTWCDNQGANALASNPVFHARTKHIEVDVHFIRDKMKKLAQSYYVEAQWFHKKYTPTLQEYMEVALVSSTYYMLTATSFLGMGEEVSAEVFHWLMNSPKIVTASAVVCRLMDDVVSHKFEQDRGHVDSSVECYMKQYNVTEEEACKELKKQVLDAWKEMNEECMEPRDVPMSVLMRVVNLGRVIDAVYKDGDGYTHAGGIMKTFVKSLFIQNLPL